MAERKRVDEPQGSQPGQPIHIKYRPTRFKDVIGQKAVVKSLEAALDSPARPHTFLFTGPAGVGKTTLARIIAETCDCSEDGIIQVDGASTSGVDDMRDVTASLRYNGFGDKPNKCVIIDECHRLSKNAWDALLLITEEPPPHVYFVFCSSEPEKIPKTIVSRASAYHLKSLSYNDLMDILEDVCEDEGYKTSEKFLAMVAKAAEGSGRAALTMLAKVHACIDEEEVAVLLQQPLSDKEIIDVCRQLVSGKLDWPTLTKTLKDVDQPAETIRIIIVAYLSACLVGARSDRDAIRLLGMLECFLTPCNTSDKMAPLLVAFGRYIFP